MIVERDFIIEEKIRRKVQYLVETSLIDEVMTTPKPGLVDDHDSGAHQDMDKYTFFRSSMAISPLIAEMYLLGYEWKEDPEFLFSHIQPIGLKAEHAMFEATEGINTHKGAIFTFGILAAAAGYDRSINEQNTIDSILAISERMMKVPMEKVFSDMEKKPPRTHGEILYQKYGIKGIRGEAEEGFKIIKDVAYPALKHYFEKYPDSSHKNEIQINVLLHIIKSLSDTCVLSRSDLSGLLWMQQCAADILALGGAFTSEGMCALQEWNLACIHKNISPGGAADILAASLFLWRLCHSKER